MKYELNANADALYVEATLNGNAGTLSYQWQESEDNTTWKDIAGAKTAAYTPSTATEKTTYYRVAVTNTEAGKKATVYSDVAWILSKVFSDNTEIHVVSSTANSINTNGAKIEATGNFYVVFDVNKPRVWMATDYAEATIEKLDIIMGKEPTWATPASSNVFDGTTYSYRAYWSATPDVALLPIKVVAENGDTAIKYLLVGTTDGLNTVKYAAELVGLVDSELKVSDKQKLTYSVAKYVGGGTSETFSDVKWASDNEAVLTIDNDGNITALKAGTATVTVTHGYATMSCKITVSEKQNNQQDNKQDVPSTPSNPEKPPVENTTSPQTGDNYQPVFWIVLSMTALVSMISYYLIIRRKENF